MRSGVIDVSFGNMKVRLNMYNAFEQPHLEEDYFAINVIQECVDKEVWYHYC